MPSVRLSNPLYGEIMKLCGKIQEIQGKRTSATSLILYLFQFASENENDFIKMIKSKKSFPESYLGDIERMHKEGLPTTKDIFKHQN